MSNLPVYVYFVFLWLLYLGVTRCFPRQIRVERLILLPALLALLSALGFAGLFPAAGWAAAMTGVPGLAAGLAAGWYHAARWQVGINRAGRQIAVPGDPAMLAILMGSFFFEFVLHFGHDAHTAWFRDLPMAPIASTVWALFLGMMAGRNLNLWARYRAAAAAA